jgi:hypothetical protein
MELLLAGKRTDEVARTLKMSVQSVQEWQRAKIFQDEMELLRREVMEVTLDRAISLTPRALKTLEEIMNDKKTKPGERIRASNAILQHGINASKIMEMKAEIERLKSIARLKHVPAQQLEFDSETTRTIEDQAHADTNGFSAPEKIESGQIECDELGGDETGCVAIECAEEYSDADLDAMLTTKWEVGH